MLWPLLTREYTLIGEALSKSKPGQCKSLTVTVNNSLDLDAELDLDVRGGFYLYILTPANPAGLGVDFMFKYLITLKAN